jgi:hypothetical protein
MKTSTKIQELLEIKINNEINAINDDFMIDWSRIDAIFQNIGK